MALASFQPVPGTSYLMAPLNEVDSERSKTSYDSSIGTTRNLVFLDSESLASSRLLASNQFIVLNTTPYPPSTDGKPATQWLVHQVLKQDTNEDGQLNDQDHQTLAVSDPAGQGYKEVLTGLSDLFGITMGKPGTLVVVYAQAGNKQASTIDLKQRTITVTKPLTDLGVNVQ